MPLGSASTLGLAGPNGTPLIAELPAPADPAGRGQLCKGLRWQDQAAERQDENKRRIAGHPGLSKGLYLQR
jgi:hypothetical protein